MACFCEGAVLGVPMAGAWELLLPGEAEDLVEEMDRLGLG